MKYEELVEKHAAELIERLVTDVITKDPVEIRFDFEDDDQWSIISVKKPSKGECDASPCALLPKELISVKKPSKGSCDTSPCALLPKELISFWVTHSAHERSNFYQENLTKKNSQQKF